MTKNNIENDIERCNALNTGDYVVTTYRCSKQSKEVCRVDHPAGDWWYALNDGLLDVGPFISETAAVEAAVNSLDDYRYQMGGKVSSIQHGRFQ
jgi:hypothetical protein